MSARKATNSGEVCRSAALLSTSLVSVDGAEGLLLHYFDKACLFQEWIGFSRHIGLVSIGSHQEAE